MRLGIQAQCRPYPRRVVLALRLEPRQHVRVHGYLYHKRRRSAFLEACGQTPLRVCQLVFGQRWNIRRVNPGISESIQSLPVRPRLCALRAIGYAIPNILRQLNTLGGAQLCDFARRRSYRFGFLFLISVVVDNLFNQFAIAHNVFTARKARDFHVSILKHVYFYPLSRKGQRYKNCIFTVTPKCVMNGGRLQLSQKTE